MNVKKFLIDQLLPLLLTVVVFASLWALLHTEIVLLNTIGGVPIRLGVLWGDVVVGFLIYIKTSVDFAIFIGNLMRASPGWRNRIAIECGTAFGNALGTCVILALWDIFRSIDWLLAIMILLAALVLLRLAEDGLAHMHESDGSRLPRALNRASGFCLSLLHCINGYTAPLVRCIVPHTSLQARQRRGWWGLLLFAMSIPFILGLDDFAGYVPLFSVVHVYSFCIGVLAGHMLLNACLFLSPKRTIRLVSEPLIAFAGSLAFIGLALWGFYEAWRTLAHAYFGF